jgi:hypothetical protein
MKLRRTRSMLTQCLAQQGSQYLPCDTQDVMSRFFALAILVFMGAVSSGSPANAQETPADNAARRSINELAQRAIQAALQEYPRTSGAPRVVVARPVTACDLQGDFVDRSGTSRFQYMGYVFEGILPVLRAPDFGSDRVRSILNALGKRSGSP